MITNDNDYEITITIITITLNLQKRKSCSTLSHNTGGLGRHDICHRAYGFRPASDFKYPSVICSTSSAELPEMRY